MEKNSGSRPEILGKRKRFKHRIRRLWNKRREPIIAFSIIALLFSANIYLYFYWLRLPNRIVIGVSSIGYYKNGPKFAAIGLKEKYSPLFAHVMNRDNLLLYFGRTTYFGIYNDYFYYILNFSDFEDDAPLSVPLHLHLNYHDEDGPIFFIRENPFDSVGFAVLLRFLDIQRSGVDVPGYHGADHLNDGGDIGKNLTGGWFDAGDYNKYSYNTAYTVYLLLEAYNLTRDDTDLNNNSIPDLLDHALWGLDWLLRMQDTDGGVFNKISSGFDYWGPPEYDTETRVTYTEKYTGTGAMFAACTALAYSIFKTLPNFKTTAEEYLNRSRVAFSYITSREFKFQPKVLGEYPGNNYTVGLAAAELYRATGDPVYLNYARTFLNYTEPPTVDKVQISGWDSNNLMGLYALLSTADNNTSSQILNYLISNHRLIDENFGKNPFGIPHLIRKDWGINSELLNFLKDSYYLYLYTWNRTYLDDCLYVMAWMTGNNPWEISFITGIGNKNPQHPYTRLGVPIPGGVVPGPLILGYNYSVYRDTNSNTEEAWKYNEYTINANAEALLAWSLLMHTDYPTA